MLNADGKSRKISPELDMILICLEMKWDYYTYIEQPAWFTDAIRIVKNADAYYHNIEKKHYGKQ